MDEKQTSTQTNLQDQFVETPTTVGLPWRILIFSFVIFVLSIFIAVGLKLGYEKYLDGEISKIDTKIQALSSSVQRKQQEFISFYSKIVNLRTVINRREFTNKIFPFLEKNTINSIYYTKAKMVSSENKLEVRGFADSLNSLSQQVSVFERDKRDVSNVVLDNVNLKEGGVTFSLFIYFNKNFLDNLIQKS